MKAPERRASGDLTQSPVTSSLSPGSTSSLSGNPTSPYDQLLPQNYGPAHAVHKSVSPSPSVLAALHKKQHEELALYQQREMAALQQLAMQQQQNQVYAAQLATEGLGFRSGQKRDYEEDNGFDGFMEDMKKRKMEPVYDNDMINRLNSISMPSVPLSMPHMSSHNSSNGAGMSSMPFGNFNSFPTMGNNHTHQSTTQPLPIPDIRTEADLALFNQFMISLGREAATGGSGPIPMAHVPSYGSGASSSPLSDQSPIEDLFNPDELASLGLGGMPGVMPGLGHDLSNSLPNQSVNFAGLYPTLDNLHLNRARGASMSDLEPSKRAIAGLPRNHSVATPSTMFGNNSYDLAGYDNVDYGLGSNTAYNFDSLAKSKSAAPATLAPRDFYKKTYRHVAPLGTAVSARTRESSERSSASSVEPEEMDIASRISVRNLLLSDEQADPSLKLPALHRVISQEEGPVALPGVDALSRPISPPHQVPTKRHTEDDIVRGVKRLELADRSSPAAADEPIEVTREMRRRHAVVIRSWLVAVNLEWRRRRLEELGAGVERMQQLDREGSAASYSDDEVTVKLEDEDLDELDEEEEDVGFRNVAPMSRRLNLADLAA